MPPDLPSDLANRARAWAELSRWERAELGRAIRRLGWSYGEIMAVVPVPKGTLARWCREVSLTPGQAEAIRQRTGSRKGVPRDTQRKRRQEVERIREDALEAAPHLMQNPLWVSGTALYWAEGSKTQRMLEMANSDPRLLRTFIAWVGAFLEPDPAFVLACQLHEGNDVPAAQDHWRRELGLPDAEFHRAFIKPKGTGHRKNHLEHGVCRVRLRRSADAFIRAMAWIDALAATTAPPARGAARTNLLGGSLAQLARATDS